MAVTGYLCLVWHRAAGGRVSPAARELGWRQGQLWPGNVGGLLGEQRETNLSSAYAGTFPIHVHI